MCKWIRQGIALLAALTLFSGCLPAIGPGRPPVMDQDGNKIFDDLDRLLEQVGPDELVPVLVMMEGQSDTMRLMEVGDEVQVKYRYSVVPAVAASMTRAQVLKYAGEEFVQHIEHDAEVRVMISTASQWFGVTKARQDFGVTGDRDGAGYSAQDVVIAVVDTGIDANHTDLDGGKVIAWRDWVQNRATPYDDNGHGTHVAGIIAGSGKGNSAYTGVAPGAALIGLKVLDGNGSGTLSNVVAAVDWAVANMSMYNIKIISMSLGTSGSSDGTDTLSQAINRAADEGIIPVIAAGNAGPRSYTVGSPGAAVKAITVGAMADVGEGGFGMASFSSRGPTRDDRVKPEIIAPGVNIMAPRANTSSGYVAYSGTSMATPFVSGSVALMLDANPSLSVQQVKDLLQQSASEWGPPGQDHDYGWGRLDTYRAVALAGNHSESGAPPVPAHLTFAGHLSAGASADHLFTVNDVSFPVNATLLMEGTGTNPDLDLYLYNAAGQEIGRAAGTSRQDQLVVAVNQTGTYRLQVRSYSGAGDYVVDLSAGTSGTVDAEPVVAIDAPTEGAALSGLVEVRVRATDDHQVSKVEVSIDGGSFQDVTASFDGTHYRYLWDTVAWPDGSHTLHARATDSAGQQAQADRQVMVANGSQGGEQRWTSTGSVSPSSRNSEFMLNVTQPGYVDFTLAWGTTADLDLFVYAPDGSFAGRAYTLNNPERLRMDTVRWGTGEYRLRVNLYSGPASSFTLTAEGYQRITFTGSVSATYRSVTHTQRVDFPGQSRVVLGWPASSDLDFFVYDPTGRERARAFTLNNPEMRDFALDTTGEWSVRVNLYSGPATSYTLHWFIPAAILG